MKETQILIFLKFPEPGKVKTRLGKTVGNDAAAIIYRRLVSEVLEVVAESPADSVKILFDPPEKETEVQRWIEATWPGEISRLTYAPQASGDLGARLQQGFEESFGDGFKKAAAIGTDCVEMAPESFSNAWQKLDKADAVFGPSLDGGYYLLGLRRMDPKIFDVPWSSEDTLVKSLERADELSFSSELLEPLTDIDTIDEWDTHKKHVLCTAPLPDQPISFLPLYKERVWGGRKLADWLERVLPTDQNYGESWEICDRPEDQSIVTEGPFSGATLHELWNYRRQEIFGTGVHGERFPLLLKILDARENLSIQVHPSVSFAAKVGDEPKTESWFIAHADEGAKIYLGLKDGVTPEELEAAIHSGNLEDKIHEVEVKTGDFYHLPSGRLHSIGAGILIYEIQQNSDTTYRVYDWNRMGLDGKPRNLHINAALNSINFDDTEPGPTRAGAETLINCEHFQVEKWDLAAGETRAAGGKGEFSIITVSGGQVQCGEHTFRPGEFFVIPAATETTINLQALTLQEASILRTTLPKVGNSVPSGHQSYYKVLRQRVLTWAESQVGQNHQWMPYVLLVPDFFHLLTKLITDPEVPVKNKAALGAVVAYFILPVDLMPEALLGPIGYLDDLALAAYAINQLVNDVHPSLVQKHWAGDGDALSVAQELVQRADEYIGGGLFKKLRALLKT